MKTSNRRRREARFAKRRDWQIRCKVVLVVIVLFLVSSCEDFVQIGAPKNELIRETVFESDLTATAAISSIYVEISSTSGTFGSITALAGFMADESMPFVQNSDYIQLYENNVVPTNALILAIWESGYSIIYQANSVIEGLNNSTQVAENVKKQLLGEAKFIRAFAHFYLLNLFGDIPLISSTDYLVNNLVPRASIDQVYNLIIADLNDAAALLADQYPSPERVRVNKWASIALLSRVYLYMGDWANAEAKATELISQSAMYSLASLGTVFLKNSSEAIWQLLPVAPNVNTNDGATFIISGEPTFSVLTDEFVQSFEDGDLRKGDWIGSSTNGVDTWYFPYKYKLKASTTPLIEYSMVLRLAEQFLIRAEARTRLNNLTGAIADIDTIRGRAGLPLVNIVSPGIDVPGLLLAIEQERRSELFSEWGHRWFDLRRTDRANIVLGTVKIGWEPTDQNLPIPEAEILVNSKLIQNPGY